MIENIVCDNCKGQKYFKIKNKLEEYLRCPKCLGDGKLDWLERLFGKKCSGRVLCSVHLNEKIFWLEQDRVTGNFDKVLRVPKSGRLKYE